MKRPEQSLQIAVAQYLGRTLDPCVVWSAIGHGGGGKVRGAILKGMGVKAGLPDLLIWWSDKASGYDYCAGIELKSPMGRLSVAQRRMGERLRRVGVLVYVCRSLDDVQIVVRELGIPSRDRYARRAV